MASTLVDGVGLLDSFATPATPGTFTLFDGVEHQGFSAASAATAQPVDGVLSLTTWTAAAGPTPQTLTAPLLTNSSTLYAPVVTPGNVTLAAPLLTNSSSLFAPVVIQPAGTQTLSPGLLTNTSVLYSPTVSPGNVSLAVPLLANTSSLFAPTVSPGGVSVLPPLIGSVTAFFSPTVTVASPGAQVLEPPVIAPADAVYTPTVSQPALPNTGGGGGGGGHRGSSYTLSARRDLEKFLTKALKQKESVEEVLAEVLPDSTHLANIKAVLEAAQRAERKLAQERSSALKQVRALIAKLEAYEQEAEDEEFAVVSLLLF